MISADYTMNVAQSHNVSQISSGLAKNNNSSRNFINFTEQNSTNNGVQKQQRAKISKPPRYIDGSASRYGNMYPSAEQSPSGLAGLPKPHNLEELHLRSTHYGGAVEKLLTTQKIGAGFKGVHN